MSSPWSLERRLGWYKGKKPSVRDRVHPNKKELQGLLNYEADRMHHNASLLGMPPLDSYGEEIDKRFDHRLESYLEHILLPLLSARISGKFAVRLTFRRYGRGGATIAPQEWVIEGQGIMSEYSGIDGDSALDDLMPRYWEDWINLTGYNALRTLLAILVDINDYWAAQVEDCPRWWAQEAEYLLADMQESGLVLTG